MNFDNIPAQAFERELNNSDNAVLIDVRTPGEFQSGHIKGAVNIDFNSPDFRTKMNQLNPDKKYLVYCRSGARSFNACNIMSQTGFDDVINLKGGIMNWHGKTVTAQ